MKHLGDSFRFPYRLNLCLTEEQYMWLESVSDPYTPMTHHLRFLLQKAMNNEDEHLEEMQTSRRGRAVKGYRRNEVLK